MVHLDTVSCDHARGVRWTLDAVSPGNLRREPTAGYACWAGASGCQRSRLPAHATQPGNDDRIRGGTPQYDKGEVGGSRSQPAPIVRERIA